MFNFFSLDTFQQVTYILENIRLIIGLIGTIGNILVFIVFSRPNLNKHSYSLYLRVMAITDIVALIYSTKNWASHVLDANLDTVSPFFCSISQLVLYIFGGESVFILTLVTLDRMLTIVYSNRFSFLKKRWFQWTMVIFGIVYNALINIQTVIYNQIVEINQITNSSSKVCSLPKEIAYKQDWIILAFFLINIVVTNFFNIKIIWFILSSRRKVNRNSSNSLSHSSARDRKFAITSVGLNLSCLVLKLPFIVAHIVMNHMVMDFNEFIAIETVFLTIGLLDNGFSFFINFFINSIFHDEFMAFIRTRKLNLNSPQHVQSISSLNLKK